MPKYLHTYSYSRLSYYPHYDFGKLMYLVTVWTLLKYFINKICGCQESKDFIWFVYRWVSNTENDTWHIVGAR